MYEKPKKPKLKIPLKNLLNLQIQSKNLQIRRHSFFDSFNQPPPSIITHPTRTSSYSRLLQRKSSLNLEQTTVLNEKDCFSLKNSSFKPKQSKNCSDFIKKIEGFFPNMFDLNENDKNSNKISVFKGLNNNIKPARKSFDENTHNKTKILRKSFFQPLEEDVDRERFSCFLKNSWINNYINEKNKDIDMLDGLFDDNPIQKKNDFEKKLIEPILEKHENREIRKVFKEFLSEKKFLKPIRYEEAYEKDMKKGRLGEKHENNEQKLIMGLKYMKKKRKFVYEMKQKMFKNDRNLSVKIAIFNWFTLMNKKNIKALQSLQTMTIYPKKPYYSKGSYIFLKFVKQNKYHIVSELLQENSKFILDFDQFHRTGLHWACYLGYEAIVDIFLKFDEIRINVKDIDGKTPLYLAANKGFISIVKKLFYYGASPWSLADCRYEKTTLIDGIYQEFKKAKKIDIMMSLVKDKKRKREIWIKESEKFLT